MKEIMYGSLNAAIGDAKARAASTEISWYVVTLDKSGPMGPGRVYANCRVEYLSNPEFQEKDGRVIYTVQPDGTFQ
jgi:hypothetical protein